MQQWLTVALQILFQEHITHLLRLPMQASPASSWGCLQLLLRVQFPGTAVFLHAPCVCVEDFSGWTDTWISMKVNIQHFPKHKLLKWSWNCSVKRNPLFKNNGHWSTALCPGKFCIRITITPPRKMSLLKLCQIADSHWWLKLAMAEQCWQRN